MKPGVSVLLVGTFLSTLTGTKGISEKLADFFFVNRASSIQNKFFRLLHIVFQTSFGSYKILHIDVFSGPAFTITRVASLLGKMRNKKIILTLRGGNLPAFIAANKSLCMRVFNRAVVVQTPSLMLKQNLAHQLGLQATYLPNFIDLPLFPYQRDTITPFSLLWVRAFADIYNPDAPIRVLQAVRKVFPLATLTMIGPDKGLLKRCTDLIHSLGLQEAVTITGPVENSKLYSYYQQHHVYLNTTRYESFGVAVVEAASCGIPVVSYAVGEIPLLWKDAENILLTEPDHWQGMAEQTIRLMSDPELAGRISKNARVAAEAFSWEVVKFRWVDLFNTL